MQETTRTAKIYLDQEIVHVRIYTDSILNYEEALDINALSNKIADNNKYLKLIDIRIPITIEEKAQRFLQSRISKSKVIAQALLVNSVTKQSTLDFYIDMNCKKLPTKVFVDYDCAISWLKSEQSKK